MVNDYKESNPPEKHVYFILSKGILNEQVIFYPAREIQSGEVIVHFPDGSVKEYLNEVVDKSFIEEIVDFDVGLIRTKL